MALKRQAARKIEVLTDYRNINPGLLEREGSNLIFRPIWCAEHHFSGPWPCACQPGPHFWALESPADEIGLGGSRGSGKTEDLLAFMAFKGNPDRIRAGKPGPADISYFNHKNYRGLILRAQANDLGDLLDRCEEMWGRTGCVVTRGNPAQAEWPTGAKIVFGHFADNGWKKYVGPQYQRIGIDQAEMMESKEIHDRIVGSCRSKWSELRPQVMLTFNPGGGDELAGAPGQAWLMDYFRIEAYESGRIPRNTMVLDEHGKRRMFIRSTYKDNPYLLHYHEHDADGNLVTYRANDGAYVKWLNSIEPESLRAAWRDSNWHALSGTYFKDFRPNGPLPGEEQYDAKHVYDPASTKMEPWFHAWGSMDWGYIHPTVFYLHRKSPWGQVYTEHEIVLNRVEPVEMGVLLAREMRPVLAGLESHHLNIYLSPDAYAKRESENTVASQIVAGINKELGPGSAFCADLTDEERKMSPEDALVSMKRRRKEQGKTVITLLKANTDRVAGWMHMQTMLRFRPLRDVAKPDSEYAERLYREGGLVRYMEYMNQPEFKDSGEKLPKWQISSECKHLIRCIPTLMHKPGTNDVQKVDATETQAGDDPADAARYGLFSEHMQGETMAPLETRVSQRVEALKNSMPGLSSQSIWMAERVARAAETQTKQEDRFCGRNRLAARRAYLRSQAVRRDRISA